MSFSVKIIFTTIAAVMLFASCENDVKEIEALTKKSELMPTESSTDLKVLFSDSGYLENRLIAAQMDHYVIGVPEPYAVFSKGIYIENYSKNNIVKSTFKADYAIRYEKTKRMEAKDNIEVVNENGEKLTTQHLIWDEEHKKIISDTYVEIRTKKEIIKGNGMEANEDFSEWEIKQVSGTIPVDEADLK